MKIKELMINDWVLSPETDTPFRIQSISGAAQEHLHTATAKNAAGEFLARGVWNPIPLTGEILQRNGWKYTNYNNETYNDEEYFVYDGIDIHIDNDNLEIRSIDSMNIQLHYVHELQHALRLCGMNDLADNFKI